MSTPLRKIAAGVNKFLFFRSFSGLLHVHPTITGIPSIARFSDSSSDKNLHPKFNVLKDEGMLFIEQLKATDMGPGCGMLVDYHLKTKGGKVLFVLEHFYGPGSPFFYVRIKNKIEEQKPIAHMSLIKDMANHVNGMTYFLYPTKIIGTLEPIPIDDQEFAYSLKDASGKVDAKLYSNGSQGLATKVRLISPEDKIIGKLTKIKQQMTRTRLDAELHYPVTIDLLVKVQLIGAVIFLMANKGENIH